MSASRLRVLFLIPSLNPGGAERQLSELVGHLDTQRFDIQVVVYYAPPRAEEAGIYGKVAQTPGVTLTCLHKRRGLLGHLRSLPRFLALAADFDPQVIHGYTEGNLPALLAGILLRRRVVWGIRRANADLARVDALSRKLLALLVGLSPLVDLVIFNSRAGLRNHLALGMRGKRMTAIPNGFDVRRFRPDPVAGRACREAWGIPAGAPLVGIAGRLDPVKDHPTFLRAAALIRQARPEARFVAVGGGSEARFARLREMAAGLGLGEAMHWAGPCLDMAAAYNALDCLLLTSADEGFPNVLGEAMACGVPCGATDVGDAALILDDPSRIAPVGDAEALARIALSLLEGGAPREAARRRILDAFSVGGLARATGQALLELV